MSLEEDLQPLASAAAWLQKLGLPSAPLELDHDAAGVVVRGPFHVVRLGGTWDLDPGLARECSNVARTLGVRTPECLASTKDGAIWAQPHFARLATSPDQISERAWKEVLQDLGRLHARPAPIGTAEPHLLDWVGAIDRLPIHSSEVEALRRVAREWPREYRLTFAHGHLTASRILLDGDGNYMGLVDWRKAGWLPPEIDYASLEPIALGIAIDWPTEPLNWRLLASLRIRECVRAFTKSEGNLVALQTSMGLWELMQ